MARQLVYEFPVPVLFRCFVVMSSDLRSDLASLFKPQKSQDSGFSEDMPVQKKRDLLKDGYVRSNQSLVLKVHRLEAEIARSRKVIEGLRTENASLRKKIYDIERLDCNERIEAIVEERIKRKMDQLSCISSRTVAHLQKAALDLKNAFVDFGVLVDTTSSSSNCDILGSKRSTLNTYGEPSLSVVSESPPLAANGVLNYRGKENRERSLERETPSRTWSTRSKSRRSELFRPGRVEIRENPNPLDILEAPAVRNSSSPTSTPPLLSSRPFFETPAVPLSDCDTVRRKRTATLKIKTMAEPKLNNKLRRPGRNDEPHPFISSLY
ncbi:hypothetical protein RB195_010713 [Necator americanus]|uniref:Shugoshin C-terminal domain-containing protein n=1 Tax=Necator americanus TaxID=51031 RepID=A0ABR1CZI1_NECAM